MSDYAVAAEWTTAFADKTEEGFTRNFAEDVVLEASVLAAPVRGHSSVQAVLAAASNIYDTLAFTNIAAQGERTYLEWEATALGVEIKGVTVLRRDAQGVIVHAAIHHRPLSAVLVFSSELARRLDGIIDSSHFHASASA